MALQSISATATQDAAKPSLTGKTVTQDDFLKLLIAQLQNQDPLQPMDNQQFAAQLATFNSLEQLIGINGKLGNLQSTQGLTNQFNATSLIGKEIATSGNAISLLAGQPVPIGYQLGANAARVVVNIHDGSGELVRQLDVGAQKAGDQSTVWDGKNSAGNFVPGTYSFEINAFDVNGKKVAAATRVEGTVTGVRLDGGEPLLELGDRQVPLSSVTSVRSQR